MDWTSLIPLPGAGLLGNISSLLASSGAPPPPLPATPGAVPATPPLGPQLPPDIGTSLNPTTPGAGGEAAGIGLQPPAAAPGGGTPGFYGGSPETNPNLKPIGGAPPGGLAGALKGLAGAAAPQQAQAQKVSTPSAPRPTNQVSGNNLIQLLTQLGLAGGVPQPEPYKLPSTLGSALGGRFNG